jgi:hypothetical protein
MEDAPVRAAAGWRAVGKVFGFGKDGPADLL